MEEYTEIVYSKVGIIINNIQLSDELGLDIIDGIRDDLL